MIRICNFWTRWFLIDYPFIALPPSLSHQYVTLVEHTQTCYNRRLKCEGVITVLSQCWGLRQRNWLNSTEWTNECGTEIIITVSLDQSIDSEWSWVATLNLNKMEVLFWLLRIYLWSWLLVIFLILLLTLGCAIHGPVAKFHYYFKFALVFVAVISSAILFIPFYALRPRNVLNSL